MFLKQLSLHGFKTFATRTELTFNSGITAIVGPNGSGKSNVADAVRWVLGEQSARPLRIKRMDDVIFAGSSLRPRVGMADVSITLDNATKWLPVDFSEVTLTRRAYRSGESEYLLNNSRVRLRDLVEMLMTGNVGQNNYTVIGQGQIDAALSLRPEERREFFEEAADIKRYQIKRNDAVGKLQSTEANLVRVRDLMAELAPRLQGLRDQAERAREQERLAQELRGYLAAWYVQRWNEASDALRTIILAEARAQQARTAAETDLASLSERLSANRQQESASRAQLGEWHRQASARHDQAEAQERALAVARATLDSTNRQRLELGDELLALGEQLAAQQLEAADAQERQEALRLAQTDRLATLSQLETEAELLESQRRAVAQEVETAEAGVFQATSDIAAAESGLAALIARRRSAQAELEERQRQIQEHEQSAQRLLEPMSGSVKALSAFDEQIAALRRQRESTLARIEPARAASEKASHELGVARNERRALDVRLETLSRLQENLTGYDSGVRSVLNAARTQSLAGVVGAVASLISVPPQYEAAVGAALGSHEQDIVMESWQAAEAAVEHLRQTRGGRATFLPLDVLRGTERRERIAGALGWAADLVQVDEPYRHVAAYLLGRVLVVRDLSIARRILSQPTARGLSSIVTLAGDIVRPGGAITGGSPNVRSSGLIERERELVELPKRIESERQKEQAAESSLRSAQASLHAIESETIALEGRLAAQRRERDEQAATLANQQRELARWEKEVAWLRRQQQQVEQTLAGFAGQEQSLTTQHEEARRRQTDAHARLDRQRQALAAQTGSELVRRLAETRTRVALSEQELRTQQTLLTSRQQEVGRLQSQIDAKERRAGELEAEIAQLEGVVSAARSQLHDLSAAIASLQQKIAPVEDSLGRLERERSATNEQELHVRARYASLERAHSQAVLDVQRARNELGKLQAQIEAEENLGLRGFGLQEADVRSLLDELAVPVQLSLVDPAGEARTREDAPAVEPDVLRRRVEGLRASLRRLGLVNPNAVQEYEESLGRYTFLATQSDDLDSAVKSLRQVIIELDDLMRARFEATFEAIGREFRRYFSILFGGGTARLTLTDPDDLSQTGVDMVAQPPGKRLQNLALLSGGERALTATALLFAILAVNPIPFCVLDEVDAALDDANIGRFRDTLKALSEKTQFIIITHNKGTMEIASALYGVSMAADSTSQVLSIKLEDVQEAA